MSEADICRTYVVPKLHAAGWTDDLIAEQRMITPSRVMPLGRKHTHKESGRPDHIPYLKRHYAIAVIEAKVDAVKRLQAETSAELDALLPSVLDKAFKGEL